MEAVLTKDNPISSKPTDPSVWMISDLFYPEETSTGHYLKHICLGLREHASVKVLSGQPRYERRGHTVPRYEEYQGIQIWRCQGTTLDKNVLAFRAVNVATIMASMMWQTWRKVKRNDVVVVTTNPPTLPVFLTPILWLRGARGVLLIHDVYPDTLVASKVVGNDAWVVKLWNRLNRRVFARASRIIAIGRDMSSLIASRMVQPRSGQIRVIPNWADTDTVLPQQRVNHPVLGALNVDKKFVVQYAGNMGPMHDIELLATAAQRLQQSSPDVHFVIFGRGKKRQWLEQFIEREGLINISFQESFSRDKQSDYLSACDVSLIPFVPGMAGVGVPSRMYNVLAAGRPLIAVAETHSEVAQVIGEIGNGWSVRPGDVDGLVGAIMDAQANHTQCIAMGERSRAAAEGLYSIEHVVPQYTDLIREVLVETSR